ncbi:MAG: 50S ribosomal protein L24e [Methanomassiliicoccales archaeon]|jgi:large subunit ribosomal protein L24e|nr:50S ribosomal protein L24e [Methanomassiliicoccales archaeon]
MVERKVCSFCGDEIEPGTGRMFIKRDGTIYMFCTSKCYKNMIYLGRVPRKTEWTRIAQLEKKSVSKISSATTKVAEASKGTETSEHIEGSPSVEAEASAQESGGKEEKKGERRARKIKKSAEKESGEG